MDYDYSLKILDCISLFFWPEDISHPNSLVLISHKNLKDQPLCIDYKVATDTLLGFLEASFHYQNSQLTSSNSISLLRWASVNLWCVCTILDSVMISEIILYLSLKCLNLGNKERKHSCSHRGPFCQNSIQTFCWYLKKTRRDTQKIKPPLLKIKPFFTWKEFVSLTLWATQWR